jgi:hypothetical protein
MSNLLLTQGISRIALVDDAQEDLELQSIQLLRVGLMPLPITTMFGSVNELVEEIISSAQAAICDHFLQQGGYGFFGAEAVAQLYDRKFPAILVSQFVEQDYDVSIRAYRNKIPVVLRKKQINPETITSGLNICLRELRQDILPSRRSCRALLQVTRLDLEGNANVIDVIIPSWDLQCPVRFPISLIPANLRCYLAVGNYLIANVNTGADNQEELFFTDFEAAPEPLPEYRFGLSSNP